MEIISTGTHLISLSIGSRFKVFCHCHCPWIPSQPPTINHQGYKLIEKRSISSLRSHPTSNPYCTEQHATELHLQFFPYTLLFYCIAHMTIIAHVPQLCHSYCTQFFLFFLLHRFSHYYPYSTCSTNAQLYTNQSYIYCSSIAQMYT